MILRSPHPIESPLAPLSQGGHRQLKGLKSPLPRGIEGDKT